MSDLKEIQFMIEQEPCLMADYVEQVKALEEMRLRVIALEKKVDF